jgi:hypothetical protein
MNDDYPRIMLHVAHRSHDPPLLLRQSAPRRWQVLDTYCASSIAFRGRRSRLSP